VAADAADSHPVAALLAAEAEAAVSHPVEEASAAAAVADSRPEAECPAVDVAAAHLEASSPTDLSRSRTSLNC